MKNTLLNFEQFLSTAPNNDTWIVQDFTNLYFKRMDNKYWTDLNYYTQIQVQDGELLDYISYKQYGTTERWDILSYINGIQSQVVLPKDNNTIYTRAENLYNRWFLLNNGSAKPEWYKKMKLKYFENICFKENEKHRYIKIIKPEYMYDFMYDFAVIQKDYQDNTNSYSDTL
jgi:hypothetical protein